ncbi:uncharacterized protein TNCV_1033621 [Trichonephila clavipes]|nr:uncharacterized protein TNCV_1033621 [Trichonephila clavipes]
MVDRKRPISHAVLEILVPSIWGLKTYPLPNLLRSTAFPITHNRKRKNNSLASPVAVKEHSTLTTRPPRHPDELIGKCEDGHNVFTRQCIS